MDEKTIKERLKTLLVEWEEEGIPEDLKDRKFDFDPMENKCNSLVGIRRSGKTYLMFQHIKELKTQNKFYINFEDERIINPRIEYLSNLIPVINETFELEEDSLYLFVDEIQNIPGWEKWARRIAEKENVFLFVSGSSSEITSEEIATSLRGRTLTNYVFPLDFRGFLEFKGTEFELDRVDYSGKKHEIKRLFEQYLKYGGFPEVVLEEDETRKSRILREYFSTIVSRDLIERKGINKPRAFESLLKLLLNNFSRQISFSKARNWMKSMGIKISKSTILKYFSYIKSSFFLFDTEIYSPSVKDRLQYPRKIYSLDNGFASSLTDKFSQERGWFFENLIAIDLFREVVKDPAKELYYWKSSQREVDFVFKNGDKVDRLIQVCSDLNEDNKDREIRGLLEASEELDSDQLTIVTSERRGEEEIEGKKIGLIPAWKFLLNDRSGPDS